ncbi:agmatine deiminase family protein [Mesorhizobium australicum]|uniref:agmatine deiminase family protein n=1 Tax=Mesorhizobium australicum TaxID=536018 RepID=UPI003EBACDFE
MFANVAAAIAQSEPVTVVASSRQWQNARARLPSQVRVVEMSTNDSWLRDSGPNFVVSDRGEVRGVDWIFNAYGGFDGGLYSPWDLDDLVARKILDIERMDRYRAPLIAEGGGVQCDGQGTLITTEQCLLNRNRNGHLGKAKVEEQLGEYLGVDKIIWLPRGFAFDETDGHVDDLCCFVRPGVVALSWTDERDDPQYEIVREAEEVLRSTRDARGRRLEVHRLHHPLPIEITMEESESVDRVDSTWARPTGTGSRRVTSTIIRATASWSCQNSAAISIGRQSNSSPRCFPTTRSSASRTPAKFCSEAAMSAVSPYPFMRRNGVERQGCRSEIRTVRRIGPPGKRRYPCALCSSQS